MGSSVAELIIHVEDVGLSVDAYYDAQGILGREGIDACIEKEIARREALVVSIKGDD